MSNKLFKFLLAGAAVAIIVVSITSVIKIIDPVFAAPKGISQMKIFGQLAEENVESTINAWLTTQSDILIDSINADNSRGDYLVGIGFHTGGTGNATTRFKLFVVYDEGFDETPTEVAVNAFLNSLGPSQTVRAIDISSGINGPVAVFILYD